MTTKGYTLQREQNCFLVREQRLCYDMETRLSYIESFYHSQLSIFVGVSKEDSWQMLQAWLRFFEDPELMSEAASEHDDLYSQGKLLSAPVVMSDDDDKDMN